MRADTFRVLRVVEGRKGYGQIVHDALQLEFAPGHHAATVGAIPLERILRDARSGAVMPPSSDISANVLGALALDVDPGAGLGMRPW